MKQTISFFFFCCLLQGLRAQSPPVIDQYVLNPVLINPAATGLRGALSFAALYRKQWIGIKGAPETIMFLAETPFSESKTGLGFELVSDKFGVTKETSVAGTYSYRFEIEEGSLSLGIKAGILVSNSAWSQLIALEPGDELFLVDSETFIVPDFGFGAYYASEKYYAGFCIPRLLEYKFDPEKNGYSISPNPGSYYYLFQGGYVLEMARDLKFQPSFMVSLSPGKKTLFDINAHFNFSEKVWAGVSFRTNKSLSGLFQFTLNNQVKAAYSYYFDFGKLGKYNKGSHEIMLRFDLLFRADVVNPLIF